MPRLHINTISLQSFNDVLSRYTATVPEKLRDLDTLRYDTIPAKVVKREGAAILMKGEVETLVEWKLKHGTFRPKLLSLVQSNSSETVAETMKSASEVLNKPVDASPLPALKILTQLKGIGPATASLLLSVLNPDQIPFFSDELFRWSCWDEAGSPSGWKRAIKYNVKEYGMLLERVGRLRERLGVKAVDVERVSWVLGKEGVDVDGGEDEDEESKKEASKGKAEEEDNISDDLEDGTEQPSTTASKTAPKKSTKRKAGELKPQAEGVRKSTRTKK